MGATNSVYADNEEQETKSGLSSSSGSSSEKESKESPVLAAEGSVCTSYGKDKIIFMTKEDWDAPLKDMPDSLMKSLDEEEGPKGVILPNGDINWTCPCLGNLSYGPCAIPFRDAFSCFHYSKAELKGSDCLEEFYKMTECMRSHPALYPRDDDEDSDQEDPFETIGKAEEEAEKEARAKTPSEKKDQ